MRDMPAEHRPTAGHACKNPFRCWGKHFPIQRIAPPPNTSAAGNCREKRPRAGPEVPAPARLPNTSKHKSLPASSPCRRGTPGRSDAQSRPASPPSSTVRFFGGRMGGAGEGRGLFCKKGPFLPPRPPSFPQKTLPWRMAGRLGGSGRRFGLVSPGGTVKMLASFYACWCWAVVPVRGLQGLRVAFSPGSCRQRMCSVGELCAG